MLLFRPIRLYLVVLLLGIAVPERSLASFGLRQNSGDAIAPSVCWNYRSETAILSLGADQTMVFLAKEGSRLEAISAADGERVWMAEFGGELVSNVAAGGNQVFIVTENSGSTGTTRIVRSVSSATGITNWVANIIGTGNVFLGIAGTNLVTVSDSGILTALRIADGSKAWEKVMDSQVSAMPLISESQLIVGMRDKKIRILSTLNSAEILNLSTNQEPTALAVGERNIYWGDDHGNVFAYNLESKGYQWKLKQGGRIIGLVSTSAGLAYASADNFVYFVSDSYGNIRWKRRLSNRIGSLLDWNNEFLIALDASGEQAYILEEKKGRIVSQVAPGESELFSLPPNVTGNSAFLFSPEAVRSYRIDGCVQK